MKEIIINKIEYGLIDFKPVKINPDESVWFLDRHHPYHIKGVMGYEAFLDGLNILDEGDEVDIKIKNKRWTWIYNLFILRVNYSSSGTKVIFVETDKTRKKVTL